MKGDTGMNERKKFLKWWDGSELSVGNPYRRESALYWAWEGFLVGRRVEREACAKIADKIRARGEEK